MVTSIGGLLGHHYGESSLAAPGPATQQYKFSSTPALSSAFPLSSSLSSFSSSTSYLPSFTLALTSLGSTSPSTASTPHLFEVETVSSLQYHSSYHPLHLKSSQLNFTSLLSLVATRNQTISGSSLLNLATAAASTSMLHNDSFDEGSLDSSLFNNLDASLYLGVNRGIVMAIVLGTICCATLVGNLLVIYAICNYRPLHSVQNMFMVSLAVADILVWVYKFSKIKSIAWF